MELLNSLVLIIERAQKDSEIAMYLFLKKKNCHRGPKNDGIPFFKIFSQPNLRGTIVSVSIFLEYITVTKSLISYTHLHAARPRRGHHGITHSQ